MPPTEEISPYAQGFRDALLSVRASIGIGGLASADAAAHFEKGLNALIDQKNHELWNLLALAQVSVPPEAQALRDHLRAPSGLLIDSMGRMLFVRMAGVEYDTGVLALLAEVEGLTKKLPSPTLLTSIRVIANGRPFDVRDSYYVSFEELLCWVDRPFADTITFRTASKQGSLLPGQTVRTEEGMIFNVAQTSSA